VPYESVSNALLGTDTSRQNLLTNGGFEVWQRGGGPFNTQSAFTADRWQLNLSGTDGISIQQASGANANNSRYSLQFGVNHGNGTQTALYQKIEDLANLVGRTLTFACDVVTATANAVRICFGTQAGRIGFSAYHTGNNQWQRLVATYQVQAADTVLFVNVESNNASATSLLDNAMLVAGVQAADYVPLHPADDLARCLRYYEVIGDAGYVPIIGSYTGAGGIIYGFMRCLARKAVNPTLTKNGTWQVSNCSQPVVLGNTADGLSMQGTVTGAGYGYFAAAAAGQNVTVEANP
jgi:hypothetical protein